VTGEDCTVIGIAKNGKDEPIILGAEPILVTGKVKAGDLICTSSKKGHGKSIKRYLLWNKFFKRNVTGKIITSARATYVHNIKEDCIIFKDCAPARTIKKRNKYKYFFIL
jgi:hypothetical protein